MCILLFMRTNVGPPLHFELFATFEFSSLSKNLKFEQKYECRAKKSYFKESRLVSEYNLAFLQYLRVRLLLYSHQVEYFERTFLLGYCINELKHACNKNTWTHVVTFC